MSLFSLNPTLSRHAHARPTVWMPALAMVLFMFVYLPLASHLVNDITSSQQQATVAAATPAATIKLLHTTTPASPTATTSIAVPVVPAVHIPSCTPLSFGEPSQLDLTNAANGLSVQADSPTLYQIYGTTAAQLRTQIGQCAPGASGNTSAEFTGETSYSLVWQYTVVNATSCSISDVKVGLHTAIALPYWLPTANASAGLAGRWQSFATDLDTHEHGHAAIDATYAAQLVNDLNAMGSVDCSDLTTTVSGIINRDVAALNQANDTYDAQTNHGATQGAVLPTY